MGRVVTPERRQAIIGWWRKRFKAAAIGKRLTTQVLVNVLDLNAAGLSAAERDQLAEARRNLGTVLALPADVQAPALDAWLARYLVDTGPHLLLDKARRNAVLASIRDGDRQERRRQDAIRNVTLRLSEDMVGE